MEPNTRWEISGPSGHRRIAAVCLLCGWATPARRSFLDDYPSIVVIAEMGEHQRQEHVADSAAPVA